MMSGDTPVSHVLTSHPVVDDALDLFRDALGPDLVRYRSHVYRGLNYQRKLLQLNTVTAEMALAWAMHDIGIWTSGWDYIPPSLTHVDELATRFGIEDSSRARAMVESHHKLRSCQDPWIESFRVADRVDVSAGLLRGGLPRSDVRQVVQTLPYDGFHGLLVRTAGRWTLKHPLRPLPMLRW